MAVQVAVAAGARVIAVADSAEKARPGAPSSVRPKPSSSKAGEGYDGLPDRVKELTKGAGADHYIELVGTEQTFLAGIRSLGRGGKLVIIGYTGEHLNIHPIELILSEIQVDHVGRRLTPRPRDGDRARGGGPASRHGRHAVPARGDRRRRSSG